MYRRVLTASVLVAAGCGEVAAQPAALQWAPVVARDLSWAQARSYCEESEASGYSDWRLPSIFELLEREWAPETSLDSGASEPLWSCNEFFGEYAWLYDPSLRRATVRGPSTARALCVRGGVPTCERLSQGPQICLEVRRPDEQAVGIVDFVALTRDGRQMTPPESGHQGRFCVDRNAAEALALLLGCSSGVCVALPEDLFPDTGEAELFLDVSEQVATRSGRRVCFESRQESGLPAEGTGFRAFLPDGKWKALGRTGAKGRFCLRRSALGAFSYVVACWSDSCVAIESGRLLRSAGLRVVFRDVGSSHPGLDGLLRRLRSLEELPEAEEALRGEVPPQ